jgi:hypothetical protein
LLCWRRQRGLWAHEFGSSKVKSNVTFAFFCLIVKKAIQHNYTWCQAFVCTCTFLMKWICNMGRVIALLAYILK